MHGLTINIVSFDIPYPSNYGGVIDIFHKVRSLKSKGVKIILHCFLYNHKPGQAELEKYCEKVIYYPRKKGIFFHLSLLAHIELTRNHKQLLPNLEANNHAFLFEAMHYCYFSNATTLKNRHKVVRAHNIKHDYYRDLQKASGNNLKKIFFAIDENHKAVLFILNKIFKQTQQKFIVTGKKPDNEIKEKVKGIANVELLANPPAEEKLSELLEDAHCCVLPTFQTTGLKLKLLTLPFASKHVLANCTMTENTGLEHLCELVETGDDFVDKINAIRNKPFTEKNIEDRKNTSKYLPTATTQIV